MFAKSKSICNNILSVSSEFRDICVEYTDIYFEKRPGGTVYRFSIWDVSI